VASASSRSAESDNGAGIVCRLISVGTVVPLFFRHLHGSRKSWEAQENTLARQQQCEGVGRFSCRCVILGWTARIARAGTKASGSDFTTSGLAGKDNSLANPRLRHPACQWLPRLLSRTGKRTRTWAAVETDLQPHNVPRLPLLTVVVERLPAIEECVCAITPALQNSDWRLGYSPSACRQATVEHREPGERDVGKLERSLGNPG